jgi:hypothetical protein
MSPSCSEVSIGHQQRVKTRQIAENPQSILTLAVSGTSSSATIDKAYDV